MQAFLFVIVFIGLVLWQWSHTAFWVGTVIIVWMCYAAYKDYTKPLPPTVKKVQTQAEIDADEAWHRNWQTRKENERIHAEAKRRLRVIEEEEKIAAAMQRIKKK